MRLSRFVVPVAAPPAVLMLQVSLGRDGQQGLTVRAGSVAEAKLMRKIGKGLRKVGQKIKGGLKKVGKAIGKAAKKVGSVVKKAFKSIGNVLKKLKEKISKKFMSFASKMLDKAKGFIDKILDKVISSVSSKLGIGVEDMLKIVNLSTGKIDTAAVKKLIVDKLGGLIALFIEGKARVVLERVFNLVRPMLDSAAAAVIGALGAIPFAGGPIAAAAQAAYSFGMVKLREAATKGVVALIKKVVSGILSKGFDFLVTRVAPLRTALERIIASATKVYGMIKKGQAAAAAAAK